MRYSSAVSCLCLLVACILLVPAVAPPSVSAQQAAPKAAPPDAKGKTPDPKAAKPDQKAKTPDPKGGDPKAKAPQPAPKPAEPQEFVEDASGGRLLLARRELTKNSDNVYIVASESKLAGFVEGLPELQKGIASANSGMNKFQRDYRVAMDEAVKIDAQYQAISNQLKLVSNPQQKAQGQALQKAMGTRRSELLKQLSQMPQHHNTHELMVHQASKGLIDGIAGGKKQAGEVNALYDKLKKDPLVEKSLKLMSAADGKTYSLGPGADFKNQLEKLEKAENQLIKSEIDVEQDGKAWLAEVSLGKQKQQFQVSPTSKLTLINNELASQMGFVVHPLTPKSPFTIDGERVSVPEVIFPAMTLGDLKVTNVRVLIVPKGSAERPVLGSTFFNGMTYRVDAKNKKLLVTRVKD